MHVQRRFTTRVNLNSFSCATSIRSSRLREPGDRVETAMTQLQRIDLHCRPNCCVESYQLSAGEKKIVVLSRVCGARNVAEQHPRSYTAEEFPVQIFDIPCLWLGLCGYQGPPTARVPKTQFKKQSLPQFLCRRRSSRFPVPINR